MPPEALKPSNSLFVVYRIATIATAVFDLVPTVGHFVGALHVMTCLVLMANPWARWKMTCKGLEPLGFNI